MRDNVGFLEKQYNKNKEAYLRKYGKLKFLKVYSKQFIRILLLIAVCALSSAGSLLLAIFYKASANPYFIVYIRVLWYTGFGIFLLVGILFAFRLPFYRKKSNECKHELQNYKNESMDTKE